jgi:hypothetical protein
MCGRLYTVLTSGQGPSTVFRRGDLMLRYPVQPCMSESAPRYLRRDVAHAYKLVSRIGQ